MAYCNSISVRLPPKDMEALRKIVEEGYARNVCDFARRAISEKIDRVYENRRD